MSCVIHSVLPLCALVFTQINEGFVERRTPCFWALHSVLFLVQQICTHNPFVKPPSKAEDFRLTETCILHILVKSCHRSEGGLHSVSMTAWFEFLEQCPFFNWSYCPQKPKTTSHIDTSWTAEVMNQVRSARQTHFHRNQLIKLMILRKLTASTILLSDSSLLSGWKALTLSWQQNDVYG